MKYVNKRINYAWTCPNPVVLLFTANSVVKSNNALVMGAGNAKACRDANEGIDLVFGQKVLANPTRHVLFHPVRDNVQIGMFRTKEHYASDSTLQIIAQSCKELKNVALKYPEVTFLLPSPGTGLGRLDPALVAPLLKILPDNVWVCC